MTHRAGLADRGQVVRTVPLGEQRDERDELRALPRAERAAARRRAREILEQSRELSIVDREAKRREPARDFLRDIGIGPGIAFTALRHDGRDQAERRTALKPRFRCTSRSEIAAGVMPEMRAAWPSVSGRCRLSFCCTSVEKPRTVR